MNIIREKLKEREPGTELRPPVAFPTVVGEELNEKGHRWVQFRTRLSLSFNFLLVRAKSKGRERENLGTRLQGCCNEP